jgi:mRNA-degrading endonuclease RelE of RelBE toxin-antitoxin system
VRSLYSIRYARRAEKDLRGLDRLVRARVLRAIYEIRDTELVVYVVQLGPRGSVYR